MIPSRMKMVAALAQLHGWHIIPWSLDTSRPLGFDNRSEEAQDLPDYFGDLNAVHELERKLSDVQHAEFRRQLTYLAGNRDGDGSSPGWRRRYCSSTAAERATALARAIGVS